MTEREKKKKKMAKRVSVQAEMIEISNKLKAQLQSCVLGQQLEETTVVKGNNSNDLILDLPIPDRETLRTIAQAPN